MTDEPTKTVELTTWEIATIRVMISPHLAAGTFPKRFVPLLRRLAEKLEAAA